MLAWNARADFLTVDSSAYSTPAVWRFDENSGVLINKFTFGRFDESIGDCVYGPDNNLYVPVNDLGMLGVVRYDGYTGAFKDVFVPLGSPGVASLQFGPDGRLYASGGGKIHRYEVSNGAYLGVFITSGLTLPTDMRFGSDGRLYVADYYAGILRNSTLLPGSVSLFVPQGSGGLTNANALTFDRDGNLYVSSSATKKILRYNGSSGASMGVFADLLAQGITNAVDLAFGPDGNLYVCDFAQKRVAKLNGTNGALIYLSSSLPGPSPYGPFGVVFTPPLPALQIARGGSGVVVSWPQSASNFVLEVRGAIGNTNGWATVTNTPTPLGANLAITNYTMSDQGFFRLRKQ